MIGCRITGFSQNPAQQTLKDILESALNSVHPRQKMKQIVFVNRKRLVVSPPGGMQKAFPIRSQGRIWVFGAGKAAARMAEGVEDSLGSAISGGCVLVSKKARISIEQYVTDHPIPGRRTFRGTQRMIKMIDRVGPKDILIFLISGGASAMLEMPAVWINKHEFIKMNKILLKSGANIHDINRIRPLFSQVKGGRLACRAFPAQVIGLLVSDVTGDKPEKIGSGPTIPISVDWKETKKAFERTGLMEKCPDLWNRLLNQKKYIEISRNIQTGEQKLSNYIIINNMDAISAARKEAASNGFYPVLLNRFLSYDIEKTVETWISTIHKWINQSKHKKICVIAGGEPTVRLDQNAGLGGRNQELVLRLYQLLRFKEIKLCFASIGTDGIDGNTNAAGACFCLGKTKDESKLEKEIVKHIKEHDSYRFFKKYGGHIFTGPTGTNVMDLQICLIDLTN